MKISSLFFALAAASFTLQMAPVSFAEDAAVAQSVSKLSIGSPAPKLNVAGWIQGDPVTNFEDGKTYMIEMWATWCGPCIAGIPHLNDLHTKFKDKGFVVIGCNVWDVAPVEKITEFVKARKDMTYRIAYDGSEKGPVAKEWLAAAGVEGIPHAFVVQKGKIIWTGHPMDMNDEIVTSFLDGSFSPEKEAARVAEREKKAAEQKASFQRYNDFLKNRQFAEALKETDVLVSFLAEENRKEAQGQLQFRVHYTAQDFKKADAIADEFLKTATIPKDRALALIRYKLPAQLGLNEYDNVIKFSDEALEKYPVKVLSAEPLRLQKESGWYMSFFNFKVPAIYHKFGKNDAVAEIKKFVEQTGVEGEIMATAASALLKTPLFGSADDMALAADYAKKSIAQKDNILSHLVLFEIYCREGKNDTADAEAKLAEAIAPDNVKPALKAQLEAIKKAVVEVKK